MAENEQIATQDSDQCEKEQEEMCVANDQTSELQADDENNEKVHPVNDPSSNVLAELETRDLWKQFDEMNTEMIVTRRGRRMFPPIKVDLHNLNPSSFYVLLMDLVPVDKYRYKYQNSQWVKCFEESCSPTRLYLHPESPALGSYWMDHTVSFYKLKLTNNQLDKQGHIIVNSMHRYQPRLHIVESSDKYNLNWDDFQTFVFPKTQFITVTAYQNDKITQLKIENNPFAKGFRLPMSRIRMRPIKSMIRSGSDNGSEDSDRGPIIYQSDGVIYTGTVMKRERSSSSDEPPSNKKRYCQPDSVENTGPITTLKNPGLKGITSPKPFSHEAPIYICANSTANSQQSSTTGIALSPTTSQNSSTANNFYTNNSISTPSFVSPAIRNGYQLVQLTPSPVQYQDTTSVLSPNETSSSEDSDDSEPEPQMATGGKKSILPLSSSNAFNFKCEKTSLSSDIKQSNVAPSRPLLQIGQNQMSVPQIFPSSMSSVITYQQPIILQPSIHPKLGGTTQHILLPVATIPLAGGPTNKPASGSPQSIYLQTCPIVQGTNSSQTLQLATLPCDTANNNHTQHSLLQNGLPVYINGHSTQIPSPTPHSLQIVTLATAPHVHS